MTDTIDSLFRLTDTAAARGSDAVTSHEAAEVASGHVWESQQIALHMLKVHGKPMTALQIEQLAAVRGVPFSASRMRSTLPELEEKNLVRRAGFAKPAKGRRRQLWEVAGDAR